MNKLLSAAIIASLVTLVAAKIVSGGNSPSPVPPTPKSAFERVTTSSVLRCSYAAYFPFLMVGTDGELTGIFYDVVNEAAHRLHVRVVWSEEVNYATINAGFATGRYDAFCGGLWPAGSRAATTLFSRPVVWVPITVWARGDDTRFDGHMDLLNDPRYKLTSIEGDATASMVDAVFPKASRTIMSQGNNIPEEILQVTTGKADAVFSDYLGADQFLQGSPRGLKDLSPAKPVLIYPVTIGFNLHETSLRDMFDVVLGDMDRDGTVARIVRDHLGVKSSMIYQEKEQFEPIGGGT